MSTNLVKIRRENNHYLSYFVELRKIIPVNLTGAQIIKYFFNFQKEPREIIPLLPKPVTEQEITNFLKELKKELKKAQDGGYPVVKREAMETPLAVELQTNTTCNLRCQHCAQPNYQKVMPFEKVEKILQTLHEAKVFEVNLTGGEFFLHPKAKKIIKLCCERYSFPTLVATNGTLLSSEWINYLEQFKNRLALLISLEGPEEINDSIRGKGNFKRTNQLIQRLKKRNFHLEISTTITKPLISHAQQALDYLATLEVPINFNLYKPINSKRERLEVSPSEYFDFVKLLHQRKDEGMETGCPNAAIAAEFVGGPPRKECRATLSGLTIDVEGEMVPCPLLKDAGYYQNKKLPLFDKEFLKKWQNNKWFKKFRGGNLYECQACSYIFTNSTRGKNPYGLSAFKEHPE